MDVDVVTGTLLLLGFGFLVANVRMVMELLRFRRRNRGALLTWTGPAPPHYQMMLVLGVATGLLVAVKLAVRREVFCEGMMFIYFGCMVPLNRRISRGFYDGGIWTDSGFIPYNEVGGLSWREGDHAMSLIVISRLRNLARRLSVPMQHYAAARRLLRDKIGKHEIHFEGTGLDLGAHDERDEA